MEKKRSGRRVHKKKGTQREIKGNMTEAGDREIEGWKKSIFAGQVYIRHR